MPYIKKEDRPRIDELIDELGKRITKRGEYNYAITRLIHSYLLRHPRGKCYDTLCDMTGVLNDVKTEFERTVVGPYEDKKIRENGAVDVLKEGNTDINGTTN